ncbi:leucyl aminopeptidase [Anaeromyxobacter diazotrophicus]|uniref:Probable cytosol aminopeptidase n=1 Tax=Anaeromyxobacter diazotrophicus TaxID=2590199 RepID=A0A7I9VJT8_9BACT|nr:leucyl aminopeptidase [Anaeromyxobacter diazotrophicus]GEJ56449.1 putative cytosol aminopeptidase [Anaeromyxobacter diazotrophicus]
MAAVEISEASPVELEADVLAVPVFEEDLARRPQGLLAELDSLLDGHLARAAEAERFRGKADQLLLLHTLGRLGAPRLALAGLGRRAEAERSGFEGLRLALGQVARAGQKAGASRLAVALPGPLAAPGAARAAVEGALLGAYRFDRYRKKDDAPRAALKKLTLALAAEAAAGEELAEAVRLGEQVAAAVGWARDLVNESPADCTPERLARAAREVAKAGRLRCEVRGPKEIAALRMGMFLGVTRGSAEEPRLVKLSYVPRGPGAGAPPLVLVGKAITFDSGGLSLKPTDSMVTMNGDMAGSAAVLAAMRVVAELAPPFPVHALLGACENMPGGRAYKPSDVLTAYDGQTVEITNTDAEGRLVLGDVLAWAVGTLAPAAVVDLATLTGACMVALGHHTAGAFGPDGPVIDAVLAAAGRAGEDVWRMPLVPALKESLKSDVADMKNTGERWGGAIAAAHFLRAFVGETPWAHLDIAGPAHASKERGYIGKGGTGMGVRTLVELVRAWEPPARAGKPAKPASRRRAEAPARARG